MLERAFKEAEDFKDEYVSTEHFLLAASRLIRDPAQNPSSHGAVRDAILKALQPSAARSASPIRIPRTNTRRSKNTPAT